MLRPSVRRVTLQSRTWFEAGSRVLTSNPRSRCISRSGGGPVDGRTVAACAALAMATVACARLALAWGGDEGVAVTRQPEAAARVITIVWGGDVTLGSAVGQPPRAGWPLLAPLASTLRAADSRRRQLRGDVRNRRRVEVRPPGTTELLCLPGASAQRAQPGSRRDRHRQPREQSRLRLRAGGLARDPRRSARGARGRDGCPRRDREKSGAPGGRSR